MTHKTQPTAHAEITAPISADLRRIDDAGAQPVEALLFEHKDGRHAVNPDTAGDPDWHRVGPVMVYAPAALQAAPPAPAALAVPEPHASGQSENTVTFHFDDIEQARSFYRATQSLQFSKSLVNAASAAMAPPVNDIAASVCQRVAELDDRDSPADWPEAMLVTADELHSFICEALAAAPALASDTESVLIDGIAYEVPATVAGELLSLHLDLVAAAPAQAVAVHWRALLDTEQVPHQLQTSLHAVGFRDKRAAESFIAEQLDFNGWRYTLEPLYSHPAPAQEHATQLAGQALPADEFRGDTASLVRNIVALLDLDAQGCLVPHGVGGHARGLLSAAASRLAAPAQAQEDAARLDCLDSHTEGVIRLDAVPSYLHWGPHWEHKTARSAIDAARAAQGGAL